MSRVPNVLEYKATNYRPAAAFIEAVERARAELNRIDYRLTDVVINRAMWHDWNTEESWAFVQEYVELATSLKAISDEWEKRHGQD